MTMKLYVGNLSYEMTEPQLQTLFSEAGEVTSAKIITDRETGQARGFGFVEMETKLEGQKAIDRRRLPLVRHRRAAASSSPTRPGTCSTRATWSPARRRRTSR